MVTHAIYWVRLDCDKLNGDKLENISLLLQHYTCVTHQAKIMKSCKEYILAVEMVVKLIMLAVIDWNVGS